MRENENEDDDVEVIKECVMLENMLELETKMRDWSPWGMDKSTGHMEIDDLVIRTRVEPEDMEFDDKVEILAHDALDAIFIDMDDAWDGTNNAMNTASNV